jgi:cytoskeletal protein RodZ
MAEFGERLRAEREGRGISLDQLCATTKVNARHFQALEQGDYKALPGGVFRRGIVRAYLSALGLEEQTWMSRFQQSYESQAPSSAAQMDDEAWATFAKNVRRSRGGLKESNTARWLGVTALFAAVLAAGWAVWHLVLKAHLQP